MPRAKRITLPGFPARTYFDTRSALDEYFQGERITCLMCGHEFKQLEPHLTAVHSMSCDDYRERFGIPYTRGLCSAEKSERAREHMRAYFDETPGERERRAAQVDANRHLTNANGHRKKPDFWKSERTTWSAEHVREFGARVIAGRTITSVERDGDVPTRTHILWMLKRSPELAKWWNDNVRPVAPTGLSQSDKENKLGSKIVQVKGP